MRLRGGGYLAGGLVVGLVLGGVFIAESDDGRRKAVIELAETEQPQPDDAPRDTTPRVDGVRTERVDAWAPAAVPPANVEVRAGKLDPPPPSTSAPAATTTEPPASTSSTTPTTTSSTTTSSPTPTTDGLEPAACPSDAQNAKLDGLATWIRATDRGPARVTLADGDLWQPADPGDDVAIAAALGPDPGRWIRAVMEGRRNVVLAFVEQAPEAPPVLRQLDGRWVFELRLTGLPAVCRAAQAMEVARIDLAPAATE